MLSAKLSLHFLVDAFCEEEKYNGRVFAIYGNKETLSIVRDFVQAVNQEGDSARSNLWGATYTEDNRLPSLTLKLGAFRHRKGQNNWPTMEDWNRTFECIPLKFGRAPKPNALRWTRLIDLSCK